MNYQTKITEAQMHPLDGEIEEVWALATGLAKLWRVKTDDTNYRNPELSLMLTYLEDLKTKVHDATIEMQALIEEGVE
jgi:hypothetical protein